MNLKLVNEIHDLNKKKHIENEVKKIKNDFKHLLRLILQTN